MSRIRPVPILVTAVAMGMERGQMGGVEDSCGRGQEGMGIGGTGREQGIRPRGY
jgi:hypothetical protein